MNDQNMHMDNLSLDQLNQFTLALLRDVTGLGEDDLRTTTTFEEINLESLAITAFVSRLAPYFKGLSKTFIFDCRNIVDVSHYLIKKHPESVKNINNQKSKQREAAEIISEQGGGTSQNEVEHDSEWPEIIPLHQLTQQQSKDAIAIIGMDGRFPGAGSLTQFWENLSNAEHAITEIPSDRWSLDGFYEEGTESRRSGLSYAKWGGFITDVDKFDPQFFGISAREAAQMDPQERLFLETAWHAMENASLLGERADNLLQDRSYNIGVFVGLTTNTYNLLTSDNWRNGGKDIPASVPWSAANRVSFALNLNGPSVAVDTACSSSLVAFHQACESIRNGECKAAITGGVNLYLHPAKYIQLCQLQMLSPTGRCHTYGKNADGFVPGEGVAAVVLKPLSQAQKDGDRVLGVVRGTSVNHSGRTNGYTVPNAQSQAQLIESALKPFDLEPSSINFIEAHGTGTKLGDPIEFTGLTETLAGETSTAPCAIASVKSNIGHLESAAGIAGILKVLLQLQKNKIAPSLGSSELNPALELTGTRFFVPQAMADWLPDPDTGLRRAGVSSFGAGGTNGHVIIEQPPSIERPSENISGDSSVITEHVFPVSARSQKQLDQLITKLVDDITSDQKFNNDSNTFKSLAYVLQCGRQHHAYRFICVADSVNSLVNKCKTYLQKDPSQSLISDDIYFSHVRSDEETPMQSLSVDAKTQAQQWSEGVQVKWSTLWTEKPVLIELPLYPFARERHWINSGPETITMPANVTQSISSNQKITFTFTGDEYFLRDHQIDGTPIFPAAAYLDYFYKALEPYSLGEELTFKNITWANPFRPGEMDASAMTSQVKKEKSDYALEFTSSNQDKIYCRARCATQGLKKENAVKQLTEIKSRCTNEVLVSASYNAFDSLEMCYGPSFRGMQSAWVSPDKTEALVDVVNKVNFNSLDSVPVLEAGMLDSIFQSSFVLSRAVSPDVTHQFIPYSVKSIYVKQRLPEKVSVYVRERRQQNGNWRVFDFSVFDQSGELLIEIEEFSFRTITRSIQNVNKENDNVHSLYQYEPYWERYQVHTVRHSITNGKIVLFDNNDRSFQQLQALNEINKDAVWQVISADHFLIRDDNTVEMDCNENAHLDLLWRMFITEGGLPETLLFNIHNDDEDDLNEAEWESSVGLRQVKNIIEIIRSYCQKTQSPRVHAHINFQRSASDNTFPLGISIAGYLRALHEEMPNVTANIIHTKTSLSEHQNFPNWLEAAFQLDRSAVQEFSWNNGNLELKKLKLREDTPHASLHDHSQPIANDVIVITGGSGAVASAIAESFQRTPGIRLALIGRSSENNTIQSYIQRLRNKGISAKYWQADCSDRNNLAETLDRIRTHFGAISGVFHFAGILKDAFFLRQDSSDWNDVLRAKVLGTHWLDELTKNDPVKWFVVSSGLAGVRGNAGQSLYGLANAWLNAFVEKRQLNLVTSHRRGKTLSIAWSLWDTETGMKPPQSMIDRYAKKGLTPIDLEEGVELFHTVLQSNDLVVIPVKGQRSAINAFIGINGATNTTLKVLGNGVSENEAKDNLLLENTEVDNQISNITELHLLQRQNDQTPNCQCAVNEADQHSLLIDYLAEKLSQVTGTPVDKIDADVSLEAFGLDSILVMELNDQLEQDFSQMSKTVLFEARNLRLLADLLMDEHPEDVENLTHQRISITESQAFKTESSTNNAIEIQTSSVDIETHHSSEEKSEQVFNESDTNPKNLTQDTFDLDRQKQATNRGDQIAIIGISGRYPGASNLDELWEHLSSGHDLVSEIPGRWTLDNNQNQFGSEPMYAKWGGFVADYDCFDPLFFGISPRDAERMDPQERLFLQTAWHTLEDAGYTPESLSGSRDDQHLRRRVGVIVGVMYGEYQLYSASGQPGDTLTNSSYASIANRVSYCLDFDGPSFAIDSMCSSSLTSISLACDQLRSGRSDAVIAGGVNLSIHPHKYRMLCELNFASTDGRCRSFGDGGDGYVPGEGVGAVLLKRLEDAVNDRDHVYAVIQGTDIGHGAKTSGYTVPNAEAQTDVIRRAFERSSVNPARLSYVEAHGTGTSLGDPIEVRGLTKALAKQFTAEQICPVGSIKSNIGHLESAAGIAALSKVLLQLQHNKIAPSIHSDQLNKNIDFSKTPFYVQRDLIEWKSQDQQPRVAAISSFGAGGSNAHLVIEEFIPNEVQTQVHEPDPVDKQACIFSAKTHSQLAEMLQRFVALLDREMQVDPDGVSRHFMNSKYTLSDVAMTLIKGRRMMKTRLAFTVRNFTELHEAINRFLMITNKNEGNKKVKDSFNEMASQNIFYGDVEAKLHTGQFDQKQRAEPVEIFAQDWVAGVNNTSVFNDEKLWRKVSLPGYTFLRNRYWVNEGQDDISRGNNVIENTTHDQEKVVSLSPKVILDKVSRGEMKHEEAREYLLALSHGGNAGQ